MKHLILTGLVFVSTAASPLPDGSETLESYRLSAAVNACAFATGYCATKYEVSRGADHRYGSGRSANSCHLVNRAVDIYGSSACLHAWAACLTVPPNSLGTFFCYKYWPVGAALNWLNKSSCVPSAHQDHLHLQPIGGCKKQVEERFGRSRKR